MANQEQRNIAYQKAMMAAQYAQEYIDMEIKREKEHEKSLKRMQKDRDRDRDRDRRRDRDRDRDRERDRDRDRERERERERERDRDRKHHRKRDRDRRDRSRRDRDRDRERERERDRERERERDRDRDRDRERDRNRDRDRENKRRDRDRIPTESPLEAMNNNGSNNNSSNNNENLNKTETGLDKAAKMMAKFGWRRGDGLGKTKQGLKGCLVPVGGYNQLMSIQDPTNVLLLQNMANKGQVDNDLRKETVEECKNFGPVLDCIIHETKKINISKEQQVSVFVKFEYIESCMNALQTFNGRYFDGRRVIASFFPLQRFDNKDFDP